MNLSLGFLLFNRFSQNKFVSMTFGKYLFFRIVKAENDTVFEISVGDSKGHTVWPIQYGLYDTYIYISVI